jgi:tRNA dimethylallyltransferase
VPVLVGGSALYTRAVVDRFEFPGTDPDLRRRLEERLVEEGAAALHGRLADVDPDAAARILPTNGRRVVRALEVIELTGRPFTASLPTLEYADPHTVQVGVDVARPVLDLRIERRVRRMWEDGFVEEVRRLEATGLRAGRTASRALGYQQLLGFLAGECTEEEAFAATVTGTRRFVRKQQAWFHKDPRVGWVDGDDPDRVAQALAVISSPAARSGPHPHSGPGSRPAAPRP